MQSRFIRLVCVTAVLALALPAFAQWGHPLKGSWSGDWWVTKGQDNHNAGLQKLTLQPPPIENVSKAQDPWILHFEADVKDSTGKTVHYVADGKMQNLGSYNRFITGTWTAGTQKGEFKVTRN